jgi:hypothetical protein
LPVRTSAVLTVAWTCFSSTPARRATKTNRPAYLAAFERYCAVTESVRAGIDIRVAIAGAEVGARLPL